jgi:hypothetical protein
MWTQSHFLGFQILKVFLRPLVHGYDSQQVAKQFVGGRIPQTVLINLQFAIHPSGQLAKCDLTPMFFFSF